jgi:hypothetical protein
VKKEIRPDHVEENMDVSTEQIVATELPATQMTVLRALLEQLLYLYHL